MSSFTASLSTTTNALIAATPRSVPFVFQRPGRISLLMLFVAFASIADLLMTLTYATTIGMMEMNPLARMVMNSGSPLLIVLWKALTAGAGIAILIWLRRSLFAEIGSWLIAFVMLGLTVHWMLYNHQILLFADELALLQGNSSEFWISFAQPIRVADR